MTPTAASTRTAAVRTPIPTPRRFLRCLTCGTVKKERSYALCSECFRQNGTLPRGWFCRWMRHAEREGAQVSFRNDPRFAQACRVQARRRRQREARAALDATLPRPAQPVGWRKGYSAVVCGSHAVSLSRRASISAL